MRGARRSYGDDGIGGDGGLSIELTEGRFTCNVHRGWGEDGCRLRKRVCVDLTL